MICKKCGTNNSSNLKNCLACGAELEANSMPDLNFMSSNSDFNIEEDKDIQSRFNQIGADYHLNETFENKNNNKGFRFHLSSKQKKYGIGCGIGCLVAVILLVIGIILANVAADKIFDKWVEAQNLAIPEIYEEIYEDYFDKTTTFDDEYRQKIEETKSLGLPVVTFDKEKYNHPTIIMLNNDELQKITEVEAFRCGKVVVAINFGSLCSLETNEGKFIKFDLMDDVLPDDVAGKYAFVKGIEDSEGNVYPEIIFLTDIDIKRGESK